MKWIPLLAGLLGLALLQASAVPAFQLFGVGPDLLLVVLCCWMVVRGRPEGMVLTPLAGIWIGLLSFQGIALSVAALIPIVLLTTLRESLAIRSEFLWALALVIAASAIHFLVLAVGLEVAGSRIDWLTATTDVLLPRLLANFLVAIVVYWLIRLPTPRQRELALS